MNERPFCRKKDGIALTSVKHIVALRVAETKVPPNHSFFFSPARKKSGNHLSVGELSRPRNGTRNCRLAVILAERTVLGAVAEVNRRKSA